MEAVARENSDADPRRTAWTAYEKLRYTDRCFRYSRGKTTTTSMISHILLEGDLDPTISVGGILQAIGGNIRVGKSRDFYHGSL